MQVSLSTPLYNAIVLELEKRRVALGLSLEAVSHLMGHADRYYSKLVNPETPSGRRAGWDVLQTAVDVLFFEGFKVRISHDKDGVPAGAGIKRKVLAEAANYDPAARRKWLAEITSLGGKARMQKLSPEGRKALAKKAARARWRRPPNLISDLRVEQ